ncbi:MAG: radical SAM protein [Bacteroidales bacterium]|nr:radical SAM protein [Bacteroidales bacterium]MCF8336411.1 radical SAM protein [Bacteroidales bacterium]
MKIKKKKRTSLLYQTNVEYGDWCLNHIENCAHGCKYPCYAMMMAKRFGRIKSYDEWINPILVENSLEILDKEIPKYKDKINFVHLCFTTDPFMYKYPEVVELTLKIIKKLNENDIKITALTKGVLPEILKNFSPENEYGVTLVSLTEHFKTNYEPYAAPFEERLKSLKHLHEAGFRTWVSIEPYPTPNIDPENKIDALLDIVSFADKIVFGRMNYNPEINNFKDARRFFEECSQKVIKFCEQNNKEHHIKFGTRYFDNKNTQTLFNKK